MLDKILEKKYFSFHLDEPKFINFAPGAATGGVL